MDERESFKSQVVDPVARANAFLDQMGTTQYADWVHEDLSALLAAYRNFRQDKTDPVVVEALTNAFQTLQDLGGTFGYPLISQIAYLAVRFLASAPLASPKESEMVHILVESLDLVITQKMTGDGGAVGQSLMQSIQAALDKLRAAVPAG